MSQDLPVNDSSKKRLDIPEVHNVFRDVENFRKEGGKIHDYSSIKSYSIGNQPGMYKLIEEEEKRRREEQKMDLHTKKEESKMKMEIKLADTERIVSKAAAKPRIDPATGFVIRAEKNDASEESLKKKIGKVVLPLVNAAMKNNDKRKLQSLFNRICVEIFEKEVFLNEKAGNEKYHFSKKNVPMMKKKAEKMMKDAGIYTEDMSHDISLAAAETLAANAQTDEDAW